MNYPSYQKYLRLALILQSILLILGVFSAISLLSIRRDSVELAISGDIPSSLALAPTAELGSELHEKMLGEALHPQGSTDSIAREVNPNTRIYRVEKGDTLASIWESIGAPKEGALHAASALRSLGRPFELLRVGEELDLSLLPSGDVSVVRRRLSDGRFVILEGGAAGYKGKVIEPTVVEVARKSTGMISSSLAADAQDLTIPASIIDDFVDLFGGRVEFRRDIQRGDTFTVSFSERHCKETGLPLPPGEITSASLRSGNQILVAIRYKSDNGEVGYFDENGNPLGNYFLRYPVQFTRISSAFSYARFHPILKRARPHNGVDFAAPTGTPVRAVAHGVIETAGYNGAAGIMVKISHGDRYSTAYLHLSRLAPGITRGVRVKRGQVIGAVGSTGSSTGPHLHFSLYDNGRYVDPMRAKLPTMPSNVKPIPREFLLAELEALHQAHQRVAQLKSETPRDSNT